MTKERWQEIVAQIKTGFSVEEQYQEDLDPGQAEIIEFSGPAGRIRLRFVTRPKLLDKKTAYSNRIGSGVNVDYVYSDSETVSHMEAYRWSDVRSDWEKFSAEDLF
ncbi:MAG: hypothetical protein C3F02_03560 [Parcubacteria group bacterium]|nr:MAG: hypothetical protein C3F02_03560 [Parcubacteria group bacterium]